MMGSFNVTYKEKTVSIYWKKGYVLRDAIKRYGSYLGYDGTTKLYWVVQNPGGSVVSEDYHACMGVTYIAYDDRKGWVSGVNPCVTMEETETYVSPFSGKRV